MSRKSNVQFADNSFKPKTALPVGLIQALGKNMKRTVITSIAVFIAGTLGIPYLVQAKDTRSSVTSNYNRAPKESTVSGYTRKDSTYVAPHSRSDKDGVRNNNWTTQGNTNPHTGKDGTIPRSKYEKLK